MPFGIGDVVGGSSRFLIPSGGEFVAQAGLEGQIGAQLDGVFEIARAKEAAPAEFVGVGNHLETDVTVPCRNVVRLVKVACPKLARRGVFIVLDALEPDAGGDLMACL